MKDCVRALVIIVVLWVFPGVLWAGPDLAPLRALPVLDGGRVKPIDTAARETVRVMTGRERFQGRDALELCLAISRDPVTYDTQAVLHVPFIELRNVLGLGGNEQYASAQQVRGNAEFRKLLAGAVEKQREAGVHDEDPRLTRLEDAAVALAGRLAVFDQVATGRRFALFPGGKVDGAWLTADESSQPGLWKDVLAATSDEAMARAAFELGKWQSATSATKGAGVGIEAFPGYALLKREVSYHQVHPFRISWVIYLAALLALCTSLLTKNRWVYRVGVGMFLVGIGWTVFSFAWRCSITGWAPVTNIYETVIWVALVGSVVAAFLELGNRSRVPMIAGAVAAVLAGVVADVMPPQYGATVRNLAPVLRSNLWLTIHVLTIVSSYAAFLVALVLGNIVLFQFAFSGGGGSVSTRDQNLKHLYRALQVGVLLVAAGTILGGLWADVSWGRFWGWDPKEVWALIILLVYLALLHGRYAGWVKPFGLAAGAVVCFLAVLMSWYGVNFILGAGLHSYGFNTGGEVYIFSFTAVQLGYLIFAWLVYRKRK